MNPPEDDFSAIAEAAEVLSIQASEREPAGGDFGLLVSGDAPPAIGGGMQAFLWFESRDAMLSFIEEYGFLIHPPLSSLDLKATRTFARSMARRIRLNEINEAEAPGALTEGLKGSTRFHWLGSFDSLLSGDTPFAVELRQEFRDSVDGRAIEPDEEEELLEFLSLYGT